MCSKNDSFEHIFFECQSSTKLCDKSLRWFNNLHNTNIGPTSLQIFLTLPTVKADTHEGFCSRSMLQAHFARVSTHEEAFSSSLNCPRTLLPNIRLVKCRGAFCGVEILLPRMKYTHEIVGKHGGALLLKRAPGACSRSKIPRVYWP